MRELSDTLVSPQAGAVAMQVGAHTARCAACCRMKRKAEEEEPSLAHSTAGRRFRHSSLAEEAPMQCSQQPEGQGKAGPPAITPLGVRIEIEADGTGAAPGTFGSPLLAEQDAPGGPAQVVADTAGHQTAKRAFHGQPEPGPSRAGMQHSPSPPSAQSIPGAPQALLQVSDACSSPAAAAAAMVQTRARSADARAHMLRAAAQPADAANGQCPQLQHAPLAGEAAGTGVIDSGATSSRDGLRCSVSVEGAQQQGDGGGGVVQTRASLRVCLRVVKLRPDGTPEEAAPQLLRSPRRTRSAMLAQSPTLPPGQDGARTGAAPADPFGSPSPASPQRGPGRRCAQHASPMSHLL